MKHNHLARLMTAVLVLALFVSSTVLPSAGVKVADAAFLGPNGVVGLLRIGAALGARNRLYREAGATTAEINAYYDSLIVQAQTLRREAVARAQAGETPARFARSYTRIGAGLEAERQAAIAMIEAEKNQARRDFNRTLAKEVSNILIASPGGQRIIGQAREAIKGVRDAAVAVQSAANEGRPIAALGDALARKVGGAAIVQEGVRTLGSAGGHGIDRALGGALSKVERAIDNVQAEMGEALDVLDELDARVAQYDEQERRPASLLENSKLIGRITPVDRANAAIDVAASAYAGAATLSGSRTTRGAVRDRIRGALLGERLGGISDLVSGREAGRTYCLVSDRGTYESVARSLGQTPLVPFGPENAVYLVCYDVETKLPVSARMLGTAAEEAADEPSGETEAAEAPPEESAAPAPAPVESEVDPCTLLPVDESLIDEELRSKYSCVATIDSLVGCNGCRSSISITRSDSVEIAQQFAGDVRCGNSTFYAKGESPIGDVGGTCTETSGEPYREGVAQGYYYISFSHGRYVVAINLTYPGQEELALSLGQEVIERIDALPSD
jgi:hypothetical protein